MSVIRRSATTTSDDEPLRKRRRSTRVARAQQSGRRPRYIAYDFLDLDAETGGDPKCDDPEFKAGSQEDHGEDYVPSDDETSIAMVSKMMVTDACRVEGSSPKLSETTNDANTLQQLPSSDVVWASNGPPLKNLADIGSRLQELATAILSHPQVDPQELAALRFRIEYLENNLTMSRQESSVIQHQLQVENEHLRTVNNDLNTKTKDYEAREQHWRLSEEAFSLKITQLTGDKDELIKQKTKLEEGNKHLLAALNVYHGARLV